MNPAEQDFYECVGRRLLRYRKLNDMTQSDLGERIGVRFQQIQKYEDGTNRISFFALHKLSLILNRPLEDFLPSE